MLKVLPTRGGSISPAYTTRNGLPTICIAQRGGSLPLHQLQVTQNSVPVGMTPQELGTACAYGQGKSGGWDTLGSSVAVAWETRS